MRFGHTAGVVFAAVPLAGCNTGENAPAISDEGRFLAAVEAAGCSFPEGAPPPFDATQTRLLNSDFSNDLSRDEAAQLAAASFTRDYLQSGLFSRESDAQGRTIIVSRTASCQGRG